jgi:hypothetical protein
VALGVTPQKWTNSALTNTGEKLELLNASGTVVDVVDYKATAPWPAAANNTGASLVLCDPKADNNDPANWAAATTPTSLTVGGRPLLANPGKASNCGFTLSYPARTIAQMTTENTNGVADSLGKPCELTGTVYGGNIQGTTGTQFFLLDNTVNTGIVVFNGGKRFGYTPTEKDRVTVRGTINQFNGLTQINADTIIKVSSDNPLLTPRPVTALSEATESSLIQIKNLSLYDPAQWTTGMGTGGFTVSAFSPDHPNDTIRIRIDNDVDLYNLPAPPQPFNLIGLGGQFDSSNPYTGGYQVLPRYRNDISTLVRTYEVDFSHAVRITPNPATSVWDIQSSVSFDRLRIFAPTGQLVRTIEAAFMTQQIDIRDWQAGVYFLQFEKDGGVWTARVVKM